MNSLTIEWILYALAAALLLALVPSFMKNGVQKTAPSPAAAIHATLLAVFAAMSAAIAGSLAGFVQIGNRELLLLLGAGFLRGAFILCMFTALSTGGVQRVNPITELESVSLVVVSILAFGGSHGLWKLCCIVLVLLGTVLMESRTQRGKGYRWLLFALLALCCIVGLDVMEEKLLSGIAPALCMTVECAFAAVLLWGLSLSGKAVKSLKRMKVENWVFLVLAGVAAGLAFFCSMRVKALGDESYLAPIAGLTLPMMMLFARIFHREKMPGTAVFGLILAMGGSFGLLLGL